MSFILETENLSKHYKGQKANDQISLHVPESSIYGLLGPNGAGKSTLMKQIIGLVKPTEGKIFFQGEELKREHIQSISAMIEGPAFYPNLSAQENVQVYELMLGKKDPRGKELLKEFGLGDTGKKKAKSFSLGMKQRLGLVLCLIKEPKLILLDEPTNGLDPAGIKDFRSWVKNLPDLGVSVVVSSHLIHEIQLLASHVGILQEGRLIYEDRLEADQDLEKIFFSLGEGYYG